MKLTTEQITKLKVTVGFVEHRQLHATKRVPFRRYAMN